MGSSVEAMDRRRDVGDFLASRRARLTPEQAGLATVLSGSATSALIVAHRLSTVRHLCTKFVVLKAAGSGTTTSGAPRQRSYF